MKICLLTRYFDFRNAGLGRFSKELKARLEQRGHDVVGISTEGKSLASYAVYTMLGTRRQMPKGFDIYHALTPMEALRLNHRNSVVTVHDLILMTHPHCAGSGTGYNIAKRIMSTFFFTCAIFKVNTGIKKVACNSEQTKEHLLQRSMLSPEDIRVIRMGIRPDLEPQHKSNNGFRVGYLGQLDKRKRVELLINAFKEADVDGELILGGIGADAERLKAVAGDDSRIKFLGLVPDDELCDFYNSLNLFVFPTSIEGYGLPIVEAMACGKPVVVMKDAVIPDEIKQRCWVTEDLSGLLHDWEDVEVDFYDNYQFAKSHDWERTTDEYESLYREVTG